MCPSLFLIFSFCTCAPFLLFCLFFVQRVMFVTWVCRAFTIYALMFICFDTHFLLFFSEEDSPAYTFLSLHLHLIRVYFFVEWQKKQITHFDIPLPLYLFIVVFTCIRFFWLSFKLHLVVCIFVFPYRKWRIASSITQCAHTILLLPQRLLYFFAINVCILELHL